MSGIILSQSSVDTFSPVLAAVIGGASLVGSLLVLLSYALFEDARSKSRHIVCWLCLCDFFQGVFFVLTPIGVKDLWCDILSIFGIFFATASFLWSACIAIFVYYSTVFSLQHRPSMTPSAHRQQRRQQLLFVGFHVVCWGYPLVCTVLSATRGVIGPATDSSWCFVKKDEPIFRMVDIYFPLIGSWLVCSVMYGMTVVRLQCMKRELLYTGRFDVSADSTGSGPVAGGPTSSYRSPQSRSSELAVSEVQTKLILIPLFFVFLRIWGCIYRILEIFYPDSSFYFLEIMQSFGDPAQGCVNFLIFVVFTKKVRNSYTRLLSRWLTSLQSFCCRCSGARATGYMPLGSSTDV